MRKIALSMPGALVDYINQLPMCHSWHGLLVGLMFLPGYGIILSAGS